MRFNRFGEDEYEVDVGTAGQVNWDTTNVSHQGVTIAPAPTVTVDKPTDWSPILDALKIFSPKAAPPSTAYAPVQSSVPGWVPVAIPVAAGALVLMFLIGSRGSRPQLAGYKRRKRR